jgi:DNA repair exonuclease SbcCD nuclease subunit/DNA repair exonuclease SbcCD ATPase subunit
MEILKKDIGVKTIYFLSDIHIKNDPSFNETYYKVFNNTFELLKKEKVNKNDLIVITGDIMDNGFAVSGNAIAMAKFLYVNLSNFCPVISILGNHDYKTNIDTLTPIVKEHLKTKNELYFLLENKVYLYGQIAFGHTRMDTKEVTPCKEYNKKYITIALYHGMLHGSKLENGFDCRDSLLISSFKDYKYCAFGDIHKQQYLRKDKTAFYTGSLIAQKISEDAFNHGTMKLDLEKEKLEFIKIQNDHKKLNLIIDDNDNISNYNIDDILKSTKSVDLQLTFGKNYKKEVSDKYQKLLADNGIIVKDIIYKNTMDSLIFDTILKINDKEIKLSGVKNSKDIFNFIKEYCKLNQKINNENRFDKNLNLLLKDTKFDDLIKQKRDIKILSLDINNIMIYGNNVNIDFENIAGVAGICETNSSGKSIFCEAISLNLFGYTPRCNISYSFVRNKQKNASLTLKLISNGIEYEITRYYHFRGENEMKTNKVNENLSIKKYVNKKKNVFTFYSINKYFNDNNNIDDDTIVYKNKNEMKTIIETEIITYDEIYQMLVMSQNREKSFLDINNSEKDELLLKMANLSYLKVISISAENLYKSTKNSIKDTIKKHCSKEFYNDSLNNHVKIYEYSKNKLIEFEKQIKDYEENKNVKNKELNNKYTEKQKELIMLNERMKMYNEFKDVDDNNDIDELINENKEYEEENNVFSKDLDEYNKLIKINEDNIKKIKKQLQKYKDIKNKHNEFKEQQKKNIIDMRNQIIEFNKFIKNCKHKNITKKEYNNYVKEIDKLKIKLDERKDKLEYYKNENTKINTISGIKNMIIEYDEYIKLMNEKNVIDIKLKCLIEYEKYFKTTKIIKNNINKIKEDLNVQLIDINKKLDTFEQTKNSYESIKKNVNYGDTIIEIENNINEITELIDENTQKIEDYTQNEINKEYEDKIKVIRSKIDIEENKEYEDYNKYNELNIELNKYEKELDAIFIKKEKTINNKAKNDKYIKDNTDILNKINKDKDNYMKYRDIKKELNKKNKEFILIEKEYNENNKLLEKNEINMNELKEKCIVAKNIIKTCGEAIDDLEDFELLVNMLKNNGLCDKLLEEQIIVNLQKAVDDICNYISHEKIYINLEKNTSNSLKKYIIIIKTDKIKDISNSGGFQKNIMELIFKLAFLRINSYFKSDMIIIDEIFDACSEENKPMAIKLLEYYKTQYNKILLVSHNQSIINSFDSRIKIKRDDKNGNSIIYN